MKPHNKIAETGSSNGSCLVLFEHDGNYSIRVNGQGLMDSKATESELALGELGTARLAGKAGARILIGGLGLGFTLRSVLERVSSSAEVHVAELIPAVVEWNREHLYALNGALLDDPRVYVHTTDVYSLIMQSRRGYDAILLDIDNGPRAMVQEENDRLYGEIGLAMLAAALRPNGRAVIWSAGEDQAFEKRLRRAGFKVQVSRAKRYPTAKRAAITLYVAETG